MGAGCYYTNNETNTKAFWIDLGDVHSDFYLDSISENLENLNFIDSKEGYYYNGLYQIYVESTYYGDGLVIRMEPQTEYGINIYNLAMANHSKHYAHLIKEFSKNFDLRMASSSYTSMALN